MKMMTLCVVSCAALAAAAYDWPAKENCLLLETSDTSQKDSSYTNGAHWVGGELPTADQDCWVPSGLTIYVNALTQNGYSFPGKSLTIEDGAVLDATVAKAPKTTYLRLFGGSKLTFSSVPTPIFSNVTVDSTQEKPVVVEMQRAGDYRNYPSFNSWDSTPESSTIVRWTTKPFNVIGWYGPFTDYLGTMRLERTEKSLGYSAYVATNNIYNVLTFANRFEVGSGVVLNRADSDGMITGGVVKVEGGAVLRTTYVSRDYSFITATNKLELGEGVIYDTINYAGQGLTDFYKPYRLFRLIGPAAEAANLPDFSTLDVRNVTGLGYNYFGLGDRQGLFDDPESPGEKYYGFRSGRPTVSMSSSSSVRVLFTNDTCWTGGVFPAGDQNAYVKGTSKSNKAVYVGTNFPAVVTFPAGGLILDSYSILQIFSSELTVTNLFVLGGADLYAADQYWHSTEATTRRGLKSAWLKGDYLGVYGSSGAKCRIAHSRLFVVDMPMYGDGPMTANVNNGTSYPRGGIEFTQINTNFCGKFTVASDGRAENVSSLTGMRLQFYASDARNIGGDMPEETFDGLTLRGDSLFIGVNSLTFDQVNRGLYVQDRIRFVMNNKSDNTLAISNSITYGGEMVFGNDFPNAGNARVGVGGGTLVLGGKARFYDPESGIAGDVPGISSNKLTMLIGKLRPTVTNALDGVAVTFGQSYTNVAGKITVYSTADGLELDVNASPEMKAKGFYSVKTGSSISSVRADGSASQIPVTVRGLTREVVEAAGTVLRLAIATVKTENAEAVRSLFTVSRSEGVRARILPAVDNGDGTSTIFGEFYRTGLMVIVK